MWCQPIHLEMLHFSDFFQWNHTKGIFRRDMNDAVLWAPFHPRCYNSFKLQLWPGSHASWAFSFSIAPMSCLATTGFFFWRQCVTMKHIPTPYRDNNMHWHLVVQWGRWQQIKLFIADPVGCGVDMELNFSTVAIENVNTKQAWWTCLPEDINKIPFKWDVLFHAIYIFCFCVSGGSSGRDVSASFDSFEAVEFTPWHAIMSLGFFNLDNLTSSTSSWIIIKHRKKSS